MELGKLPKIDRLLAEPRLESSRARVGQRALKEIARAVVGEWRERVRSGASAPESDTVVRDVLGRVEQRLRGRAKRVVNATGVLVHTNLGRAPLPEASVRALEALAGGYQNLEYDIETGVRSRRGASAERALAELVGAEDALIVNNNAAAVLLCLSTLGAGRHVVVSRGELVEIGGGFRIPEVLERSGAKLVEVGTTNRTRVSDYEKAIDEETACLLRVHPSNFKITGFTERPSLSELAALANSRSIPLVEDLGGGLIVEERSGYPAEVAREPTVQSSLRAGAHAVCFSLDKLFGGPQGGVVVGRAEIVGRLREDPMARALRIDKLMLAALEPVIAAYSQGDIASIPVHAALTATLEELENRARGWLAELGAPDGVSVARTQSRVGGGALAEEPFESAALVIDSEHPTELAKRLRGAEIPVIARIHDDRVWLDPRTVLPRDDEAVVVALRQALGD